MSKPYVLFYRLNEGITEIFLLKSFQGIKKRERRLTPFYKAIHEKELKTFCKDARGNFRKPADISKEIETKKILAADQGRYDENDYSDSRPYKSSADTLTYVSNNRGFYNLPGGQANTGETILQTALREVEEELNIPKDLLQPYLEKSLLIGNIYYVDYDEIDNEVIKNILVDNDNISNLGSACNIYGIELSEFGIKKWVNKDKYNRIFKNPYNKFYNLANNIPIKIPIEGGDYYIKYLKYKAKYLKLLSQKKFKYF